MSLAVIPLFAARGALPLLSMAAIAKFTAYTGQELSGPMALVSHMPEWITSGPSMLVLAGLSIAEHFYNKSPDLREMFPFGESEIKGIGASLLVFTLVGGNTQDLVDHVDAVGGTTDFGGFFSVEYVWSFVVGGLTWFVSGMRNGVYFLLTEMDPMDDIGIRKLLSFLETSLGIFGPLLVVLLPLFAMGMAGIATLSIFLLKRYFEKNEAKQVRACEQCGQETHLCAPNCRHCNSPVAMPHEVGLLGQAKKTTTTNQEKHQLALLQRKRCDYCAERSKKKGLGINCGACGRPFFISREEADDYLENLKRKLPKTLLVTTVCSGIPIIGIIPGILYYRLTLISGLRVYLPRLSNFGSRWLVRICCLLLLGFQWVPILGLISLPIMCLINYSVYSSGLKQQFSELPETKKTANNFTGI